MGPARIELNQQTGDGLPLPAAPLNLRGMN